MDPCVRSGEREKYWSTYVHILFFIFRCLFRSVDLNGKEEKKKLQTESENKFSRRSAWRCCEFVQIECVQRENTLLNSECRRKSEREKNKFSRISIWNQFVVEKWKRIECVDIAARTSANIRDFQRSGEWVKKQEGTKGEKKKKHRQIAAAAAEYIRTKIIIGNCSAIHSRWRLSYHLLDVSIVNLFVDQPENK